MQVLPPVLERVKCHLIVKMHIAEFRLGKPSFIDPNEKIHQHFLSLLALLLQTNSRFVNPTHVRMAEVVIESPDVPAPQASSEHSARQKVQDRIQWHSIQNCANPLILGCANFCRGKWNYHRDLEFGDSEEFNRFLWEEN